jgi:hypothetical protein
VRGYRLACLIILGALVALCIYVAAGYGLPGGSIYRRMTGREGPTGGLTTAMRFMLRGELSRGARAHAAAPFVFAWLVLQVVFRALVLLVYRKPEARSPRPYWLIDVIGSILLFAAAIYIPWLAR